MEWAPQITQIDNLLKLAKHNEARQLFLKLAKLKWPRHHLEQLCNLARRLNEPYILLKKLKPVVNPEGRKKPQIATIKEIALYSFGLSRIGACVEAHEMLAQLPDFLPEKFFYMGLNYIYQWQYYKAIQPLKNYLKLLKPESYEYLVGSLNLISALSATKQSTAALEYVEDFLKIVDPKYLLLKANAYELKAQALIFKGEFNKARECLKLAGEILMNSGSKYDLFVKKWNLIIKMFEHNQCDQTEFREVKELALKGKNFEIVRELDFHFTNCFCDPSLFQKVYFGTRFIIYRSRFNPMVRNKLLPSVKNKSILIQKDFHNIKLSSESNGEKKTFDLNQLVLTSKQHQLLRIILSEFYSPLQLGEVFRRLYPAEYFDPYSSVARLYTCYRSLKDSLKSTHCPIEIMWQNRQIHWRAKQDFNLLVNKAQYENEEMGNLKNKIIDLQKLDELPSEFRKNDIEEVFGKSDRSIYRFINDAIKSKKIIKFRRGVYRKTDTLKKAA